uniref:Phosphatidylethanolamine-binding protein n=1 Tax=Photinus pyralis TaxID=7054 RepID=A0A1Y1N6P1_PHOPY
MSCCCKSPKEPSNNMIKMEVVADVIDQKPAQCLTATFANNVKVNDGNELTPTQVKDPPSVQWNADPNKFYLLVMTDPDAPSRSKPDFREWHHWLVGNIPGLDVEKGEHLSEYIGSAPPEGTGLHRYVLLVYEQQGQITFDEPRLTNTSANGREKFSIRKLAQKYNLGEPIAGNFYQAKWDDYVPIVYKQLGG